MPGLKVYLPGAGWRGFDPTEGSLVVNRHIFLTSTAKPELAAPISGTFRGRANSTLALGAYFFERIVLYSLIELYNLNTLLLPTIDYLCILI